MKRAVGLGFLALALVSLGGCPPVGTSGGSGGVTEKPPGVCTKAGQSCEYSPGKIGLCTAKSEACEGSDCLHCMSLH